MKKKFAAAIALFLSVGATAQEKCDVSFVADTLTVPGQSVALNGESVEVTLKNQATIKIFRAEDDRLFMRMVVTENFYFNKVDMLEIQSGTKSYYAKETKQYKLSKTRGQFTFKIFRNYLRTLQEYGITAIVFGGAETDLTKQDTQLIKKIAACMYEATDEKQNKIK
jgi:hypothetical protein